VYGARIKYLRFLNSSLVLSCSVKKVLEPFAIKRLKTKDKKQIQIGDEDLDDVNLDYNNPERSSVEIVYKIIGSLPVLQQFIHEF
jgi:hypothetical protein